MNLRLLLCIGMGVLVVHIGVVMILAQLRARSQPKPFKPNFFTKETRSFDPETGETTVQREITVSTRIAPRETPR